MYTYCVTYNYCKISRYSTYLELNYFNVMGGIYKYNNTENNDFKLFLSVCYALMCSNLTNGLTDLNVNFAFILW